MRSFSQMLMGFGGAGDRSARESSAEATVARSFSICRLRNSAGRYEAAPLPFKLDALEPFVHSKTLGLHYTLHHKLAAAAANKAEEVLARYPPAERPGEALHSGTR